jgi:hypothetical protein
LRDVVWVYLHHGHSPRQALTLSQIGSKKQL